MINDNGRRSAATEILKTHGTKPVEERFLIQLSASDLWYIAEEARQKLRKRHGQSKQQRRLEKALGAADSTMQSNGIPKSLRMFKITHERPEAFDPDMFTKLALPPQSVNAFNDRTRANDGATDAENEEGVEMDDGTTKPTIIGDQSTSDLSRSPAIAAATTAAIKRSWRNPKRFGG